jgi:F-type H+-transporting ATPase subunit alpha
VPVEEQVIMIFTAINGYLDDITVEKVRDFEGKILKFIKDKHPGIALEIKEKKKIDEDVSHRLKMVISEFKKEYK